MVPPPPPETRDGDLPAPAMLWLKVGFSLLAVFCFLPRMLLVAAWLESRTIEAQLGLDERQGEKCWGLRKGGLGHSLPTIGYCFARLCSPRLLIA